MREYLEEKSFIPPFGLDKFLVALGLPDRQPELYLYISERYHVHPDWPSILLIHSRSDEVVPVSQTEVMAVELEAFGIPHQVHYFDGASHYLMSPSGEAQGIFDTTINFLENEFAAED
jgi:dipeptidyl aminopeptidase/acylaminoacyl peptidase